VDAEADPLTLHWKPVVKAVEEVMTSVEASAESTESTPAPAPATDDAWFF